MARKATYDQAKVKELRAILLEDSFAVFNDELQVEGWSQFRKDLLMKYAPRVLPTINEISGPDGGEIPLPIYGGKSNEE